MERRIERGRELPVNQYLPPVILLLVAIFWGTSYGVAKEALLFTSVLVFLVIRFVMTTLILLPIVIYRKNIAHWKSVIPTGVILFLIFVCETYGIKNTTASNAAFLISLFVVFTPFVEWLVNKKKPTNKLFFLSIVSVIGVFLLTNITTHELNINTGDILMLMAALLRGIMVVFTKKVMVDKDVDPIMVTSVQSSVVSIFSVALLLSIHGFEWINLIPLDLSFWLLAIYLVLFCTVFAFYAQNYSVKKMSPTKVSILMGSEPIFGALFAFLWLSESFTLIQIIGASLIFIATFIVTRQEAKA
ncbi:DMT family transporter [Aliivibrio logei]|uniref:DMT family transporter n=1 Tax=Aliivibrio logei TaxID=688 RepID=UPI0035C91B87